MPNNHEHTSPKDVFLHLLMIGTLYASVISFLALIFQYVNFYFPDPLTDPQYGYGYPFSMTETMRNAVAALIIVFPVFILISRLLQKEFGVHPEKMTGRLRKWLIAFTLFVASIVIIVDLIILILHFLEGELAIRFLLKNLSILLVIGFIFGYYFNALKKEQPLLSKNEKIFVWIVSLIIVLSVIGAFVVMGSPFKQRLLKQDWERVSHLQTIQGQLVAYYQQKSSLPESLSLLRDDISGFVPPRDPKTGNEYEYFKRGDLSFSLCAIFETTGGEYAKTLHPERLYPPMDTNEHWSHNIGRVCFERAIDSDRYPILKKEPIPIR